METLPTYEPFQYHLNQTYNINQLAICILTTLKEDPHEFKTLLLSTLVKGLFAPPGPNAAKYSRPAAWLRFENISYTDFVDASTIQDLTAKGINVEDEFNQNFNAVPELNPFVLIKKHPDKVEEIKNDSKNHVVYFPCNILDDVPRNIVKFKTTVPTLIACQIYRSALLKEITLTVKNDYGEEITPNPIDLARFMLITILFNDPDTFITTMNDLGGAYPSTQDPQISWISFAPPTSVPVPFHIIIAFDNLSFSPQNEKNEQKHNTELSNIDTFTEIIKDYEHQLMSLIGSMFKITFLRPSVNCFTGTMKNIIFQVVQEEFCFMCDGDDMCTNIVDLYNVAQQYRKQASQCLGIAQCNETTSVPLWNYILYMPNVKKYCWNQAPGCIDGEDRITININRPGELNSSAAPNVDFLKVSGFLSPDVIPPTILDENGQKSYFVQTENLLYLWRGSSKMSKRTADKDPDGDLIATQFINRCLNDIQREQLKPNFNAMPLVGYYVKGNHGDGVNLPNLLAETDNIDDTEDLTLKHVSESVPYGYTHPDSVRIVFISNNVDDLKRWGNHQQRTPFPNALHICHHLEQRKT